MRRSFGLVNQSMSGDRGARGWKATRTEFRWTNSASVVAVEEFDRLRQQQQRRRCEQYRVGHRDDGADRAGVVGAWPVGAGLCCCLWRTDRPHPAPQARGAAAVRLATTGRGLKGRCRLRRRRVEMPERQHKLDRQRQQREPRPMFDVRRETTSCRSPPRIGGQETIKQTNGISASDVIL